MLALAALGGRGAGGRLPRDGGRTARDVCGALPPGALDGVDRPGGTGRAAGGVRQGAARDRRVGSIGDARRVGRWRAGQCGGRGRYARSSRCTGAGSSSSLLRLARGRWRLRRLRRLGDRARFARAGVRSSARPRAPRGSMRGTSCADPALRVASGARADDLGERVATGDRPPAARRRAGSRRSSMPRWSTSARTFGTATRALPWPAR